MRGWVRRGRTAPAAALLAVIATLALPAVSGAVSPFGSNGRIVHELGGDIGIMAADGSGQTNLTFSPELEDLPTISPTGSSILFWRLDAGAGDIWGMRSGGSAQTNLTRTATPVEEFAPVFFPDGRRVAYSRQDASQIDIWTMRPDGSDQRQLTDTPMDDEFVGDISANGRRIVFSKQIGGINNTSDIWVMKADGSGATNLTKTASPVAEYFASFSPSGKAIAYDRAPGGPVIDVWAMRADGSGQHALAATGDQEGNPVFAPDGGGVLYSRCGANCELFTVELDGSNPSNLTKTPATQEDTPEWESVHRCAGRRATIVGDNGPDVIKGTRKADVILGFGGRDRIVGRGGNDRLCGGKGKDRLRAGKGRDRCKGGPGRDRGRGCERGRL